MRMFRPHDATASWSKRDGAVAQLGERLVRNEEVRGSIPLSSTTIPQFQTFGVWRPGLVTQGAARTWLPPFNPSRPAVARLRAAAAFAGRVRQVVTGGRAVGCTAGHCCK